MEKEISSLLAEWLRGTECAQGFAAFLLRIGAVKKLSKKQVKEITEVLKDLSLEIEEMD